MNKEDTSSIYSGTVTATHKMSASSYNVSSEFLKH